MSTLRTTTPEPGSVPPLRCLQLNVRSAMTDPTSDGNVHVPVLAQEVTRLLGGRRGHDDLCGLLVDATLGAAVAAARCVGRASDDARRRGGQARERRRSRALAGARWAGTAAAYVRARAELRLLSLQGEAPHD